MACLRICEGASAEGARFETPEASCGFLVQNGPFLFNFWHSGKGEGIAKCPLNMPLFVWLKSSNNCSEHQFSQCTYLINSACKPNRNSGFTHCPSLQHRLTEQRRAIFASCLRALIVIVFMNIWFKCFPCAENINNITPSLLWHVSGRTVCLIYK